MLNFICHTISFQQKTSTLEGQPTGLNGSPVQSPFARSGSKHVSSFDEVKARNAGEESAYDKAECFSGCWTKIGGFPPKWMVKIMENPIKMDDLGVPLLLETLFRCPWHNFIALNLHPFHQARAARAGKASKEEEEVSKSLWHTVHATAVSPCVFELAQNKHPFASQLASSIACQSWDHPAEFSLPSM